VYTRNSDLLRVDKIFPLVSAGCIGLAGQSLVLSLSDSRTWNEPYDLAEEHQDSSRGGWKVSGQPDTWPAASDGFDQHAFRTW
jgi:hypothetical protein